MRRVAPFGSLSLSRAVASLVPLGLAAFAVVSVPPACTTNGALATGRTGFLPDGAPIGSEDGGSTIACVFGELDTFTCPDVSFASAGWVGKCVDGDDCSRRMNGTTTTAGCTQATQFQDVQEIGTTCAAFAQAGGVLPSIDSGAPSVCAPGSVSSFKPSWHPPRSKTTQCTKTQVDSYWQCLNDEATTLNPASCAEWRGALSSADDACLTCLSSNEADASYGPLVLLPTELLINVAGCIALAEGKTDGSGCGGALQADEQCQRSACLPNCPTATTGELTAEGACETAANVVTTDGGTGGVCATYATTASCAGAIETEDAGGAAEAQCFGSGSGASAQFEAVALAFCGP